MLSSHEGRFADPNSLKTDKDPTFAKSFGFGFLGSKY
jgi:hypothetical protein